MARVLTFSQFFPAYHFRKGEPTFFVEKFINSIYKNKTKEIRYCYYTNDKIEELNLTSIDLTDQKHHTIRIVKKRRWKAGDFFSPRVWGNDINPKSGRSGAYHSKQIIIAPDIEIKKVWDIEIWADSPWRVFVGIRKDENTHDLLSIGEVALNDGLTVEEFIDWFQIKPNAKPTKAQILCWNTAVNY